jgi:hypothetical protein
MEKDGALFEWLVFLDYFRDLPNPPPAKPGEGDVLNVNVH